MATASAQIRDHIVAQIGRGDLKPGDRLPSRPELERRFRCARATVDKALGALKSDGLIRTEFGRGTFVAERRPRKTGTGRAVVVIPRKSPEIKNDIYVFSIYRELARGLSGRDRGTHLTVEEPHTPAGPDAEALRTASVVYWVRPSPGAASMLRFLADEGVPQVLLNRDYGEYPCVCTDAAGGQRAAVARLAKLGHRRIGYVHLPVNPLRAFDSDRMIGFLEGVHAAGLAPDAAPRLEIPQGRGGTTESAITKWLRSDAAPSAVVFSSSIAGAFVRAAGAAGLRIPDDISVLTVDEVHDPNHLFGMRFTCQRQRLAEIGRRAAKLTASKLRAGDRPLKVRLVPDLVDGDTTTRSAARRGARSRKKR